MASAFDGAAIQREIRFFQSAIHFLLARVSCIVIHQNSLRSMSCALLVSRRRDLAQRLDMWCEEFCIRRVQASIPDVELF